MSVDLRANNQSLPFFFLGATAPQWALASSFTRIFVVSRSHTTTHRSRQDSSGRVISSSQRPLPNNTQHSQQTDIHAPGGIRTHDLSRRAVVDLRLRPRGHWDRQLTQNNVAINYKDDIRCSTYRCFNKFQIRKKLLSLILYGNRFSLVLQSTLVPIRATYINTNDCTLFTQTSHLFK